MNIEYRKVKPEEAERVCYIVQHTKEVIYPDYYTKAVMDFFFDKVGTNRIECRYDPRNPHSGMVMKKCGMKYEGTMRSSDRNNQGICDASWYALLKSER